MIRLTPKIYLTRRDKVVVGGKACWRRLILPLEAVSAQCNVRIGFHAYRASNDGAHVERKGNIQGVHEVQDLGP
jgi:hypothetical protein